MDHDYTPKGFNEFASTLSCHQMGGLERKGCPDIRPVDMGIFQAEHLLGAGYVIVYEPDRAAEILADGVSRGYIPE